MAEESDRLKTAFLSNMSHEIRTPMNAIIGFSYLLRDQSLSPETKENYIEIITSKGNLLLNIINDIIDIAKEEAGEIEIHKETCHILKLFEELRITYSKTLELSGKSHISLKINLPEHAKEVIFNTDIFRLKQILSNLIDNAIKFTKEGFIETGFSVQKSSEGPRVRCYVKDTGIGISEKNLSIIFNRFRQIDESHTRTSGGTGLGLAISKYLVEMLGGELKVESVLGEGSTFSFSLPYVPASSKIFTNKMPEKKEKIYDWHDKTILIVEDNQASYFLLRNYLLQTGTNILFASDGKNACDLIQTNPNIQLVLMDIQLPVINGYDATRLIKSLRPELPVIAQTAHALPEDRVRSAKAGFDQHLTKPIARQELLTTLSKYLD
jgi:CheY-like chemotaxis protein